VAEQENIVMTNVVAIYTDELVVYPVGHQVEWFKDELGTVWCKFNSPEEEANTTCIPQLYVTRVDLE